MPGVFEFYRDRIKSCPSYGFKAGGELLDLVIRCVNHDQLAGYLTIEELNIIMNLCVDAHIKMLEEDFNNGWHEQNPER